MTKDKKTRRLRLHPSRVSRCYWQGEDKTKMSLRTEMTELRLMLEQYHKETARAETARLERKHD